MKKILTLLFAVVTVAAFAGIQQPVKLQKQQQLNAKAVVEKAQMGEKVSSVKGLKGLTDPIDTLYNHPTGSFFVAFYPTETGYSGYSAMLIPGGLELTWPNLTTGYDGNDYTWLWYDEDLDPDYYSESNDVNLVTNWRNDGYGFWYAPRLYVADAETFYRQDAGVQYGGKMEIDVNGDQSLFTNMCQFYPWDDYRNTLWLGACGAGTDGDEINFWESWIPAMIGYGEMDSAIDYAKIVRYVQIFDYPGKPYSFSRIQMFARANAQEGQVITAKVCRVENNTIQMDSPIAEATYEFPAAITTDESAILDFYFEKYDPVVGLYEEDWITIDGDMCIVIEGADKLAEFYALCDGTLRDAYQVHSELANERAYCEWEFYSNDELYDDAFWSAGAGYVWGNSSTGQYYLPDYFLMSINAQFAFIENDDDAAVEKVLEVPAEGGTYTFDVRASESYDAWTATEKPEWVEVSGEDVFDEDDYYTCVTTLTVTVAPGEHSGNVVFTLPGVTYTIKVNPGEEPATYYLVGDFNGWNQTEGMLEFVANEDGVLETEAELEAGAEFKVITPNGDGWTWYGGVDENNVGYFLINNGLMNTPLTLVDGSNFRMENGGIYTLQLNTENMTLTVVPQTTPVVPGDVNGDGFVTSADVTALYSWLLSNDDSALVNPDQDGDGNITAGDVTAVYNILLGI